MDHRQTITLRTRPIIVISKRGTKTNKMRVEADYFKCCNVAFTITLSGKIIKPMVVYDNSLTAMGAHECPLFDKLLLVVCTFNNFCI
jgi:hypothetical protein